MKSRQPSNTTERLWSNFKNRAKGESQTPDARNAIAVQHRNLVRKVAHQVAATCGEAWEDLEQIGMIGLVKAIDRFDPTKGVSLSSFAVPWIRGEMLHHLRDNGGNVKVPRRMREANSKANAIERRWAAEHNQAPTEKQVAAEMGVKLERLRAVRQAVAHQQASELQEFSPIPLPEETWEVNTPAIEKVWGKLRKNLAALETGDRDFMLQMLSVGSRKAIAHQFNLSQAEADTRLKTLISRVC